MSVTEKMLDGITKVISQRLRTDKIETPAEPVPAAAE